MIHDVILSKTSLTMEAGTVVQWFKKEGETVKKGDPLYEVQTDKAAVEIEATCDGVLERIIVGEGEEVPVNTVIAHIKV